jgi:sRNA-binding carbon storage regulator CsrA
MTKQVLTDIPMREVTTLGRGLTINRRVGEKVMVYKGNPPEPRVVVTVVSVDGLQVKINIRAPGLHIDREEVYLKKQAALMKGDQ